MTYPTYNRGFPQPPPQRPPFWAPAMPPPPKKQAIQLWLIAALLSLLVTLGIGLAFVLHDEPGAVVLQSPTQSQSGNGQQGNEPTEPRSVPTAPADCLVECTQVPPASDESDADVHYSGSDDAAAAFLQDIADGDATSAHNALCGAGKNRFPTPDELLADFYATLGISQVSGARLSDVHAADEVSDAVVFELDTDVGAVTAEVYIVEEASSLTVCGYDVVA